MPDVSLHMRWLPRFLRRDVGSESQYGPVVVHGRQLTCLVCGHGVFWEHHVQLHTPFLSFMDWEWLNRTAHCAVCARCGHMHWFVPRATAAEEIEDPAAVRRQNESGG
jgi:hypothetical protein